MRLRNLRRRPTFTVVAPLGLLLTLVALLTLATLVTLATSPPASAATADEVRVLDLANQVRASVGAQPLAIDESISVIARRWAATVAAAGRISHNPEVGGVTSGSSALAENVVVGPSIAGTRPPWWPVPATTPTW
ncbi:MAG: CAP domain-containing protein, partial [Actinomycetota bacterium]|nr:CAP domain-containing protein [Actinomycetota bacterium]